MVQIMWGLSLLIMIAGVQSSRSLGFRDQVDNIIGVKQAEVNFFTRDGREHYETIQAYPSTLEVLYTVRNDEDKLAFVVDDYVRGIRIVRHFEATACRAFTIENTTYVSGDEFANLKTDTNHTMKRTHIYLDPSNDRPLVNPDLIGDEAKSVCKGLQVYWHRQIDGPERSRYRRGWWSGKKVTVT